MYAISRPILMYGALAMLYSLGLLVLILASFSPMIGLVMIFALIVRMGWPRKVFTAFGTAKYATEEQLQKAKMTGADQGLILGRLAPGNWRLFRAISRLGGYPAKEACSAFLGIVMTGLLRMKGPLVRMPASSVHSVVFAPTGAGKDVSCIIPFLMTSRQSAVVLDVKGDLVKITGEQRRKMGGVIVLDPFGVTGLKSDTYNPLDWIDRNSPTAIDDICALASALVVRTGQERERHFDDCAEEEISGLTAFVVQYGAKEDRSLPGVDTLATNSALRDQALGMMEKPDDDSGEMPFDGLLARLAGRMKLPADKEKASIQSTVARHLRFLRTPMIQKNTRKSSFDPRQLTKQIVTIYICYKPEYMRSHAGWGRMVLASLFQAVIRNGLQEKNKVNFILNEAASLGQFQAIEDAIDKYRSYGIRLQLYYQSVGQLKACFPVDGGQTLMSNASKMFFAVNDLDTAKLCSDTLGKRTIAVEGGGTNWGGNSSVTHGTSHSESSGNSSGGNSSWSQQGRELLRPEEILNLPPQTAVSFIPGVPPVVTTTIRYFEETWLTKQSGMLAAVSTLLCSVAFTAYMFFTAYFVTKIASDCHVVQRYDHFFMSLGGYP